ncbi:MAG TPA: hypothetical protein VE596_02450 [Gaiellaceae bacterium]|jgi:hypothetical protein|nr:hypothetical protein [Gaiellaceae bacterium]
MRRVVVLLALTAASAVPGDIQYPVTKFMPVGDSSGWGTVSWLINPRPAVRTFCWEMSFATKAQPLFVYLRRGALGRVVGTIDVRPNNPLPWQGSGSYSGCMQRRRALILDLRTHPRRYYLDVRTVSFRHAIRARLHGPPLR